MPCDLICRKRYLLTIITIIIIRYIEWKITGCIPGSVRTGCVLICIWKLGLTHWSSFGRCSALYSLYHYFVVIQCAGPPVQYSLPLPSRDALLTTLFRVFGGSSSQIKLKVGTITYNEIKAITIFRPRILRQWKRGPAVGTIRGS